MVIMETMVDVVIIALDTYYNHLIQAPVLTQVTTIWRLETGDPRGIMLSLIIMAHK